MAGVIRLEKYSADQTVAAICSKKTIFIHSNSLSCPFEKIEATRITDVIHFLSNQRQLLC